MENVLTLCRTNRPLPDPIVISSSGRWAAVSLRPHETDLVQLPSGKSILRLGGPRMNPVVLGFSPDESKIVVGNAENPMVGVWDLRELSQELAELDLEPEALALSDPVSSESPEAVEFVGVDKLDLARGIATMTLEQAQDELESLEQLYSANPKSALAANNLAWNLMMAPEPLCDVNRAIELAEQAVRDAPGTTTYRNTLGAVLFHAGHFERAIEFLKQNVIASPVNELPWDLYYLAISYAAIDQVEQAEMYLQMADRWSAVWRESQPNSVDPLHVELLQLKTEASARVHQARRAGHGSRQLERASTKGP